MGDDKQCLMKGGGGQPEQPGDILRGLHIKAAGGLVGKDDRGLCDQCPCNRGTLLCAAREHVREGIKICLKPQQMNQSGKVRRIRPGVIKTQGKQNILKTGHRS